MYTTSLFHKSLIDEVRKRQNGRFLTYGISDANMAAISVSMEKKYIYSEIPLGWVGTSPKVLTRSDDFIDSIKLPLCCGNYRLGFVSVYFLGALLTTEVLDEKAKDKLADKKTIEKIISTVFKDLNINNFKNSDIYKYFLEVLKINNLNLSKITKKAVFLNNVEKMNILFYRIISFPCRCIRYVLKRISFAKKYFITPYCSLYISWADAPDMTMEKASEMIMELINKNLNFEDLEL